MAELEPQPAAGAPHSGNGAAVPAAGASSADPIQRLHKMSTTAGAGAQEYVAINNLAVAAAFLGAGAALAVVFQTGLFLILGVAGVVLGGIAIYQIQNSNGTQGGRLIALGGMALAALFTVLFIVQSVRADARRKATEREVDAAIAQLGTHLRSKDFRAIYAAFAPELQKDWPYPEFETHLQSLLQVAGTVGSAQSNGVYQIQATGDGRFASTLLVVDFERFRENRQMVTFRQVEDGQWKVVRWGLFDRQQPRKQGGGGGGGGGGPTGP